MENNAQNSSCFNRKYRLDSSKKTTTENSNPLNKPLRTFCPYQVKRKNSEKKNKRSMKMRWWCLGNAKKSSFNVLLWHIHQRTQNGCEFSFSFATIHIVNSKYAQAIGWGGRFLLGFLVPVSYFFFSACNVNALIWAHLTLLFTHRASLSSCKRCVLPVLVWVFTHTSPIPVCKAQKVFIFLFLLPILFLALCMCVCAFLSDCRTSSKPSNFFLPSLRSLSLNIAC